MKIGTVWHAVESILEALIPLFVSLETETFDTVVECKLSLSWCRVIRPIASKLLLSYRGILAPWTFFEKNFTTIFYGDSFRIFSILILPNRYLRLFIKVFFYTCFVLSGYYYYYSFYSSTVVIPNHLLKLSCQDILLLLVLFSIIPSLNNIL